jgi:hypothetical protein
MKMNQRRTGFATRDRVISDFLRAVGNVRVAVLYRIAVYRSLNDYFRHRLVPLDTVWHIQSNQRSSKKEHQFTSGRHRDSRLVVAQK